MSDPASSLLEEPHDPGRHAWLTLNARFRPANTGLVQRSGLNCADAGDAAQTIMTTRSDLVKSAADGENGPMTSGDHQTDPAEVPPRQVLAYRRIRPAEMVVGKRLTYSDLTGGKIR